MRKREIKTEPDPIDRYVGARVRASRVGQRISQTKLGDAIGVTFQQIQKYENGTNRIGASNLFKIAGVLGVEVGYFYENIPADIWKAGGKKGLSDSAATMASSLPFGSREAIELTHNYYRISDAPVRKRIFQLVKSLAETDNA
ncbi:MAG: helix-turn-helix domain-containing protein [Rhodospirillales bacterium]|nr:helix-turn-helix domain-containing protein [Rhodospirillales bacterium]MCW9040836.1 helix-turn-helix domain-containing protein [Rhodospirillales bacterium]